MSSVPVSQYEALRAEMRSLVQQAQQVQEIATQIISTTSTSSSGSSTSHQIRNDESELCIKNHPLDYTMESLVLENTHLTASKNIEYEATSAEGDATASEDECGRVPSTQMSVSSEPISHTNRPVNNLYHGTWPVEKTMWNSEPTKLSPDNPHNNMKHNVDQASVLSFASSSGGAPLDRVLSSPDRLTRRSMQQLEAKVDMVYSLLAMLGGQEHADMGDTLLALSTSPESCLAMRQSGCIPLLVQLVQSDKDLDTRRKASQALHNLVYAQPDEKLRKRETRVLKLLEQSRAYTEALKNNTEFEPEISSSTETQENGDNDKHPVPIIANLMKHSFDEGHRQAICQLGGIHIIASLVETEHTLHGSTMDTPSCILLRRYACMALTNLTFGDSGNKALLCSFREFMRALVIQLQSPSDELRQVTASVLRNLSWRADQTSKEILREVGTVAGLMKAGMATTKENTLKSILSALWNLSAHCTENKLEICAVESGLGFLVDMLSYKAPSKSLTINENAGGILRNISSQIAVRDDYREILRKHNCLQILLEQLKSPSLTIVSNACGTLWNLSAKNQVDQEALWQMGAPAMLRSLNHSKHKMIATGSSAALKNLLNSRPSHSLLPPMDTTARSMDLPVLPTLGARKQKALMRDLDQNLSETFENLERDSPTKVKTDDKLIFERTEKYIGGYLQKRTKSGKVSRSESHEFMTHTEEVQETRKTRSETSTQSDLCNGFSSLNLGEPSTSYQKELRNSKGTTSRLMQGYSSSSLVYMNSAPRKNTFIPVRNNYSDTYPEDIDTSEQPIDYSRKYSETKLPNSTKPFTTPEDHEKRSPPPNFQYNGTGNKLKEPVTNYGIYAETDLDQPTDYSLRYAEDDSDSDICVKITKDNNEFVQDTVKTYCTEGTPLNFSTATSMSDLRIDVDKNDIDNDKSKDKAGKTKIPTLSHLDEKDHCSVEDISDSDNRQKCNEKTLTSQLSSGLMSPEKPVNYCEEGTPGYFSRVSSFGSLNSIPVSDSNVKVQSQVPSTPPRNVEEKINDVKVDSSPGEAKVVKFVEPSSNCAEQTPLMFSRSSSLGSLDSVEQHSIHDDRSSVISDFSRLTSGIVSPSELPDSPTQTVPPSPRPRKGHLEYPSTSRNSANYCLRGPDGRPQPAPRSIQKPSVFEDNLTKFKEESTPVQFSTATSISSLTIDDQDDPVVGDLKINGKHSTKSSTPQTKEEGSEKQDTEQEKRDSSSEFNEQLSENDEDEDILADCINIGMQNNRHRLSKPNSPPISKIPSVNYKPFQRGSGIPLPRTGIPSRTVTKLPPKPTHSDSLRTYCTEDTPAVLSHAGSNSDLSVLSMQTDNKSKKDYLSDDSSNLSGDNDNILAECIQSGMPKAKTSIQRDKRSIVCPSRSLQTSTPIKPFARGESSFAKKTQCLPSHLGAKDEINSFAVENSPCQFSLRSSLSDLTVDGSVAGLARTLGEGETSPQSTAGAAKSTTCPNDNHINLSRQESLSSLSVESFGSIETEQALLEQCISSGMPKSKHNVTPNKLQEKEKPIGVATKHFNPQKNLEIERCRRLSEKENGAGSGSKNVNVASAVGNTNQTSPEIPLTAAGVETTNGLERLRASPKGTGTSPDTSRVRSSRTEENLLTDLMKSGCEKSLGKILDDSPTSSCSNSDNCINMEKQELDSGAIVVDNRMLDPEAMIESLDRFTAELVSQASSHLQQKEENKYITSVTEGDTWNEDLSPNDLTFPSISGSAPNVITFESEPENPDELDEIDGIIGVEQKSNDFSSLNTSTMTESTLIAMEATRMATTFQQEAELCQSINSLASLELDQVQPPSQLNSLTSSGLDVMRSPKVVRKRSLPASLMVRRALSNTLNQGSSLESLENHSLSNLDQVNPPSAMGEVLDMDGSMVSVASINSEAEDDQPKSDKPNSIFTIKQPSNLHHLLSNSSNVNSLCDLDNVNPPSLFNEITDLCNSLADVTAENIETEVFEDCTLLPTENEVTEFSDANSATPIQTDMSSAESTPTKKIKSLNKQLTPKQRRHLAKERYKTYTVAAEMVMREEEQKLNDSKDDEDSASEDYRTVACDTETYKTAAEHYSTATFTRSSKTTPKERRQMDQDRFQTQVLDKSVVESLEAKEEASQPTSNESSPEPTRSKLSIRRSFVQKRLENRDRFKTQTITEASLSPPPNVNSNDLHYMVQREANKVLKTLGETKSRPDELLDCETLSLVSNDDDSEHNSGSSMNYRTYHKSWGLGGNNIPVIQPASPSRISSDLENYHPGGPTENASSDRSDSEDEAGKQPGKPKIVKPSNKVIQSPDDTVNEDETQNKGIRGRRKPLYSKANLNNKMAPRTTKPIKTVTSNLVKNVTSSLKSSNQVKTTTVKQNRNVIAKPPIPQNKGLKAPTNYNKTSPKYGSNTSNSSSPKGSPVRSLNNKTSPKHTPETPKTNGITPKSNTPSPLERQGTFTKEDKPKSKIPSAIPKAPSTSRIAKPMLPQKSTNKPQNVASSRTGLMKSASADRAHKPSSIHVYNRSPSADGRERTFKTSPSSQSLKNGTVKKNPEPAQRSSSSSSLASNNSSKQITSRIANLWKKVEESKKQPPKKDSRIWIQNKREEEPTGSEAPQIIRSSTFENKESLLIKKHTVTDETKRVSRLGSFLVMDEDDFTNNTEDLSF